MHNDVRSFFLNKIQSMPDLKLLEKLLDEALENETEESLRDFLLKERNNKSNDTLSGL